MDDNLLFRLWGKTNERDDKFKRGETGWRYHPAICHMIDVAYMAKEWLRLSPWLLDRFQQLAPGIEGEALRRLIVCIVALHDLAKVHRFFQAK